MRDVLGPQTILGYCTNVHAGATYAQTRVNLERYALPVKQQCCPQGELGIGLWLSADAAAALLEADRIIEFRHWLAEHGLAVFTLNGFPYGDFHDQIVKHRVYLPHWGQPQRYQYTLNLARILSGLLPQGAEGSISTVPIGWRSDADDQVEQHAAAQLLDLVHELARLELDTGRYIHIDLEPEPGCLLDTSGDVVRFFQRHLLNNPDAPSVRAYLKVCHDVCHAAVMFEPQHAALANYRQAGIAVGKVQLSSAVAVNFDQLDPPARQRAMAALAAFDEPRYLHQTTVRHTDGTHFYEDLPQALARHPRATGQWRVHFHVPVFLESLGDLPTTRNEIRACIEAIQPADNVHHFEVETYAWNVLPGPLQSDDLAAGIAAELQWIHREAAR